MLYRDELDGARTHQWGEPRVGLQELETLAEIGWCSGSLLGSLLEWSGRRSPSFSVGLSSFIRYFEGVAGE